MEGGVNIISLYLQQIKEEHIESAAFKAEFFYLEHIRVNELIAVACKCVGINFR